MMIHAPSYHRQTKHKGKTLLLSLVNVGVTRLLKNNVYGRVGLGKSPVDRGRKGLKISVLTDSLGVVHNIRSDAASVSDL